jgi:hypothetical protein
VYSDRCGAFVGGMFDEDDGCCDVGRVRACAVVVLCDVVDDLEDFGEEGFDLGLVARVFEVECVEFWIELAIKSDTEHESSMASVLISLSIFQFGIALR